MTVNATGCRFESDSKKLNIYLNLYFWSFALMLRQSATLISTTQHAILPEFGGKWGMKFTRFPLPILLCAGYNVKLI